MYIINFAGDMRCSGTSNSNKYFYISFDIPSKDLIVLLHLLYKRIYYLIEFDINGDQKKKNRISEKYLRAVKGQDNPKIFWSSREILIKL